MISETRTTCEVPVLEVFASIQGEGAYVGQPQTFIRLRGCSLRCTWCDTPESWVVSEGASAEIEQRERAPGFGAAESIRQEAVASPFTVLCWVAGSEGGRPRTISLTGGEPLLYPEFIVELARLSGERRLHLETAGAHPESLERVLDSVDHFSVDLKLPSSLRSPVELSATPAEPTPVSAADWKECRRRTLTLVRKRDACLKLVLPGGTRKTEVFELLDDVASFAPELTVYLQPVTPVAGCSAPSVAELQLCAEACSARNLNLRVVPQVHRLLGVR